MNAPFVFLAVVAAGMFAAAFYYARTPPARFKVDFTEARRSQERTIPVNGDLLTKYGSRIGGALPQRFTAAVSRDQELIERLRHSGTGLTPVDWWGMRIMGLAAGLIIGFCAATVFGLSFPLLLLPMLGLAGLGLAWPASRLKERVRKRQEIVAAGMPAFLHSLLLGLKAGETLTLSFTKSVEMTPPGPFREELQGMVLALRSGGNLGDVFGSLAAATGDPLTLSMAQRIRLGLRTGADIEPVLAEVSQSAQARHEELIATHIAKLPGSLLLVALVGALIPGFIVVFYPMVQQILQGLA